MSDLIQARVAGVCHDGVHRLRCVCEARRTDRLTRLPTPDTPLGYVHGYHVDEAPHVPLRLAAESVNEPPRAVRHHGRTVHGHYHMEGNSWLLSGTGHAGTLGRHPHAVNLRIASLGGAS